MGGTPWRRASRQAVSTADPAATAIGMEASGAAVEPKQLTCDRPFGYALVHLPTTTPLFVGVVADPTT